MEKETKETKANETLLNMKQKKRVPLWLKILLPLVTVLFILPMAVTAYLYEGYFGNRAETSENETTLTIEDFPELSATEINFPSGDHTLTGYLYFKDNNANIKGMVIVCHGIWSNHTNLLTEINTFVENDYLVFAYDNTGTVRSQGDSIIGLVQSQLDLDAALTYLENDASFQTIPKLLYGHSWGAYAVTSVLNYDHDVNAVAAMAPFNQSIDMLLETGSAMYGDWLRVMTPYLKLYERIKFGSTAGNTALEGINNVEVPVLIYHSDNDGTISLESSVYAKREKYRNKNVEAFLTPSKGHDPFLSYDAILYRQEYATDIADGTFDGETLDKELYYQLDADVFRHVLEVFDEAVAE